MDRSNEERFDHFFHLVVTFYLKDYLNKPEDHLKTLTKNDKIKQIFQSFTNVLNRELKELDASEVKEKSKAAKATPWEGAELQTTSVPEPQPLPENIHRLPDPSTNDLHMPPKSDPSPPSDDILQPTPLDPPSLKASTPSSALGFNQPPTAIPQQSVPPDNKPGLITLENGSVGKHYSVSLKVVDNELAVTEATNLPVGFVLNVADQTISGVPTQDGDFTISLLLSNGTRRSAKLYLNPDPWSLWREVEPGPNLPFRKIHLDKKEVKLDEKFWPEAQCVGASRRGRSHAQDGSFREDDLAMLRGKDPRAVILCVSDGAGSSKYSRQASLLATQSAAKFLHEALTADNIRKLEMCFGDDAKTREWLSATLGSAAHSACAAIQEAIQDMPGSVWRDFACTFLSAIALRLDQEYFVAGLWIGDGGLAALGKEEEEEMVLLGTADSGEFAGQTVFLNPKELDSNLLEARLRFQMLPKLTAIIAATDGVTDPMLPSDALLKSPSAWWRFYKETILPEMKVPKTSAEQLLNWLQFRSPGNHDDRTIAVLSVPP